MAMRGRDGRGNPNRPQRLIINRVYEQFKPMSEWREEDDYDTLLVHLPGFQKEYMKVTTEDLNIVRVRGERLVAENKWSRFQEDYRVPENCEMRGIRAKFDGGILTITMPRKFINVPPPPTTAPTRVAPKTEEQPRKPKEERKEKKPDKPQTTRLENSTLPPPPPPTTTTTTTTARIVPKTEEQPRTPKEEPKEKKPDKPQTTRLENSTLPPPPPPTTTTTARVTEQKPRKPKEEPKEKKPDKPQTTRLEDNTLPLPPKPTSSTPTKQPPSKPAPEAKEVVESTIGSLPRKGIEHDVEKPGAGEKTDLPKGKGKETIPDEEMNSDVEGSKGKPNSSGVVSGGLQGIVARRGMMNEDRRLLFTVGVGVLIIAALGVHVSYTIGLIGKEK